MVVVGLLSCFFAVLIGAFGAHALTPLLLENKRIATFETANHYHFFHALALLLLGFSKKSTVLTKRAQWVFGLLFVGVVIFSGSLYALSITNIGLLGAVTPIGGTFLLCAWLLWAIDELSQK